MYKDQEQLLRTLTSKGLLSATSAEEVRTAARDAKKTPEEIIISKKLVGEQELTKVKSELLDIPMVDLHGKQIPKKTLGLIPQEVADNYQMVAFDLKNGTELHVGLINPQNFKAIEAVEFLAQKSGMKVKYFLISPGSFREGLRQYRELGEEAEEALSRISEGAFQKTDDVPEPENMERVIKSAPVSKMVLVIMRHAIDGGASDIHIEPAAKETRVRYRIDGILRTSLVLPKYIHAAITARIKVLANLKLDETRKPQDGRIRLTIDNNEVDFRVSTLPMVEGEKVVLRILDTSGKLPSLQQLGFNKRHSELIAEAMKKPTGMVLLTGPTGSGKTTTLYTLLTMLNEDDVNIITLEDPIEYYIQGINQSQTHPEVGYTFASGLRAILRQDPNVIMLGEVRDSETTELVIHASLTGHMVLTTLHTNDAVGAFARLMDLKAEPFLLSSVVNIVIAQRLTRKICTDCKEEYQPPAHVMEQIKKEMALLPKEYVSEYLHDVKISAPTFYRGKGCARCGNQGYKGRLAIAEIIVVTSPMREIIARGAATAEIKKELEKQQFITLAQDGIVKAIQGITTIEEVMRVSQL